MVIFGHSLINLKHHLTYDRLVLTLFVVRGESPQCDILFFSLVYHIVILGIRTQSAFKTVVPREDARDKYIYIYIYVFNIF